MKELVDFSKLWTGVDWVVLLAYFVGVVGVGMFMHRKASTSFKSFFVASRRLTIPVIIGVAAAGWYDSWTFVGLAECGATMGICILVINVIPAAIFRLPLALWIGPFTRDKIPDYVVTMPDLITYLFNKPSGLLSAITPALEVFYSAALLSVIGGVLHLVSGLNIVLTMCIAGGAIILYTTMAGLWALSATDLVQFAVMTFAAGLMVVGILVQWGGLDEIWAINAAQDPNKMTLFGGLPFSECISWGMGGIAMYTSAQSYQRFGAAKGGSDIRAAYTMMMGIGVVMCCCMVLIGMTAAATYPDLYTEDWSAAYWGTVFGLLPPGCRGLVVAAIAAAVMSTTSADLLVASGVVVNDVIRPYIKKDMDDQGAIKATRIGIVVFGVLAIIGTIFWADGIARAWYYIGGFMVAVFFVPIVGGLFYKKKTRIGGMLTLYIGLIFYCIWEFVLGAPFMESNFSTWIFSFVLFFTLCPATYKWEKNREEQRKLSE